MDINQRTHEVIGAAIEVPLHDEQLLTYLLLGRWSVGLPINFNVPVLTDGIPRRFLSLSDSLCASASLR
ncbi:MAG: hypothetical protein ABSD27_03710 [Bryobacteraceae bacterium]|jgi:hypothetical protein